MSDPLLAQSAIDRLLASSYELVVAGQSYRRRQRPRHASSDPAQLTTEVPGMSITDTPRWSLAPLFQ